MGSPYNAVDIRIVRIFNTYGPRMAVNDGRVVRQTTSAPELTRRSHRWLPKKPAPPVTTIRLGVMQTTRAGTTRFGCPKMGLGSFGIRGMRH